MLYGYVLQYKIEVEQQPDDQDPKKKRKGSQPQAPMVVKGEVEIVVGTERSDVKPRFSKDQRKFSRSVKGQGGWEGRNKKGVRSRSQSVDVCSTSLPNYSKLEGAESLTSLETCNYLASLINRK